VIAVRYDADTGASIVTESEAGEPAVRSEPTFFDKPEGEGEPRARERVGEESVESGAGAGA